MFAFCLILFKNGNIYPKKVGFFPLVERQKQKDLKQRQSRATKNTHYLIILMKTFNLFSFCQRIYYIKCFKTKKVYIGQSENCLYRIGRHFNDLKSKVHHCESLQKDFLKYGAFVFEAKILLHKKSKIKNEKNRKKLEEKIISTIGPLVEML